MRGRILAALIYLLLLVSGVPGCASSGSGSVGKTVEVVLTGQELQDLALGSSLQATRGTNLAWMNSQVQAALREGLSFRLISANDVPDRWLTVSVLGVGGAGEWKDVTERVRSLGLGTDPDFVFRAVDMLSAFLGREFQAVVRGEAGEATVYALLVAAHLGVPVVDACLSGRSRPRLEQQVSLLAGLHIAPAALTTPWGDTIILINTVDDRRAEEISRAISVASGGSVAVAMNAMSGSEFRKGTISGSLSQAIAYGRALREALGGGQDPIRSVLQVAGGTIRFQGIVVRVERKPEAGFSANHTYLSGTGPYSGHDYSIYIKNEYIAAWMDGRYDILPPDLIWVLDPATAYPVSGAVLGELPLGKEVVVGAVPAPEIWRSPQGLDLMGPESFGLETKYLPFPRLRDTELP